MLDNLVEHAAARPVLAVTFLVALVIVGFAIPYFLKQNKTYGSPFTFASKGRKVSAGISGVLLVGLGLFFLTPYVEPPSNEVAIVLGNTQNTPAPSLNGKISESIVAAMLAHKGADRETLIDSIKFISAVKQPEVIDLTDLDIDLRKIGSNTANAKRDAKINIEAITEKIDTLLPSDNGANYLEAILEAKANVKPGSRIIVIGSGLSDSGYLNFSKGNILTNEDKRKQAINDLQDRYSNDLEGYTVEFYGLGDTVKPQEVLSALQKGVVRDIYKEAIRKLGGKAIVDTHTRTGEAVVSQYVVGTTDSGCGDINLVFDDNDLKFVGDQAVFIDAAAATTSLSSIKEIWEKQRDTIVSIQIDGYTAHYPGAGVLSQDRANAVKEALVGLGVSGDKLTATGKGYGPHDTDAKNRTVKVNISRDNNQCMS